jgi:DNA-directed RNA polymerase subunit beta'
LKDIINIIKKKSDSLNFNTIKISLSSAEQVLSRSYGEIKKAETINYRTFKPERNGLFCAKIFGPTSDYRCLCGKYKKLKHRGVICEKCGVEVTLSNVRRSRMAHISLASPVAHIWFLKSSPSKIGLLLDLSIKDLEKILYFEQYIVIDPGSSLLKKGQFLTEEEFLNLEKQYGNEFIAKIGGEAIKDMLRDIDLNFESEKIKKEVKISTSDFRRKKLVKRLKLIDEFKNSDNNPEWMMMEVLPVLPPDLRPLVPLDGGRFASSDLNDLYRRVINRNNRLKKLLLLFAPDIIVRNEKRMLQEAVDSLLDNGRRGRAITGSNKRPLKSLSDMIKGKHGRFRQNLLGKRVDYSGRSVIVVGPNLKLNQCGLPKKIALELFKPFIFGELKRRNLSTTIKQAKKLVDEEGSEIWKILSEIVYEHPILLNRAPTLHRLGIQAFDPILIDGKAIQLHPLVCAAFNADFDGDQMAVHIPLTLEAQLEARILIMSTSNVLSPANGEPIVVPSQDIILGLHYMTKEKSILSDKFFINEYFLEKAYENRIIDLHTKINFKINNNFILTTYGRLILSKILPKDLNFSLINKEINKKDVSNIINFCYKTIGIKGVVSIVDQLMYMGFKYATKSGISIGIEDISIPKEKYAIIRKTQYRINKIEDEHSFGLITKEERYNKIIDLWSETNDFITDVMMKNLSAINYIQNNKSNELFNPIYMMAQSGARGSVTQIRQLAGMRGLMAKPDGSIIETPITANFREGLNVLQYFISTHGARKGLADTALKTANSGYLTRRLVDVAQDVVINIYDCNTSDYIIMTQIIDSGNIIETLNDKIYGRILQEDLYDDNNLVLKKGQILQDDEIKILENLSIESIKVRSVIKCEAQQGICAKCYGIDLSSGNLVTIGEAVGVIAAQSIGEPGTQLTMRTFHIGGAASRGTLNNNIQVKNSGKIEIKNIKIIKDKKSDNYISISKNSKIMVLDGKNKEKESYKLPYGCIIYVNNGSIVKIGDIIATWDPHNTLILSETDGYVKFIDLIDDITIKKDLDKITGLYNIIIIDPDDSTLRKTTRPSIKIIGSDQNISYSLSPGTIIHVKDNQCINVGDIIAKIPRGTSKVKDITGGLPRVADIFEARKPKDPAILSPISGVVNFGRETKDKYRVLIKDKNNNIFELMIPKWKNLNFFENEIVMKGDILSEGEYNLHDILKLLGIDFLINHIKKEVHNVYRLQGVRIDDKHIEIIIRQMLRKVIIKDAGDSELLKDNQENLINIKNININLIKDNKKTIKYESILLGITKASLSTDSFISAASFQETTRVLTDAAVSGKKDKLLGLKENVIVGKLIPAGTGFYKRLIDKNGENF